MCELLGQLMPQPDAAGCLPNNNVGTIAGGGGKDEDEFRMVGPPGNGSF